MYDCFNKIRWRIFLRNWCVFFNVYDIFMGKNIKKIFFIIIWKSHKAVIVKHAFLFYRRAALFVWSARWFLWRMVWRYIGTALSRWEPTLSKIKSWLLYLYVFTRNVPFAVSKISPIPFFSREYYIYLYNAQDLYLQIYL